MVSVSWEFVSLGRKRDRERDSDQLQGVLPPPPHAPDPLSPDSATLVAQKPSGLGPGPCPSPAGCPTSCAASCRVSARRERVRRTALSSSARGSGEARGGAGGGPGAAALSGHRLRAARTRQQTPGEVERSGERAAAQPRPGGLREEGLGCGSWVPGRSAQGSAKDLGGFPSPSPARAAPPVGADAAPGRVDGPGVSLPPPDAGIRAPGRGTVGGDAQARTCPPPGAREPEPDREQGKETRGRRSRRRSPRGGRPQRAAESAMPRRAPGRRAAGRRARRARTRRAERAPAARCAGAPGRRRPSPPLRPPRLPANQRPPARPAPAARPRPAPRALPARGPSVCPRSSGSAVSVCAPASSSLLPLAGRGGRWGVRSDPLGPSASVSLLEPVGWGPRVSGAP